MKTHLEEKLNSIGQKKILALDGGGIRGIIAIEILAKIEQELRDKMDNQELLLCEYFDFVAGTSTGALIGACVSMGMSVDKIRTFYKENGKDMFDDAGSLNKLTKGHRYHDKKLKEILKKVCGLDTTLGTDKLKTLFLSVMYNIDTDSPWPVSNNPYAKYNTTERGDESNLHIPLWKLLRASTAAPSFFKPEEIKIGSKKFTFIDGAITPYNNPAFQAYLMSTLKAYNLGWNRGEDKLLLVSIGTGEVEIDDTVICIPDNIELLKSARTVPAHLLNSISYQQDMMCRILGKCLVGDELDREIGDLKDENGSGCTDENLFTYLRYNVKLDKESLEALNLSHLDPKEIAKIDAVENLDELQEIGRRVAEKKVVVGDFEGFFEIKSVSIEKLK